MPRYVDLDMLPLVNIDVGAINKTAYVDIREVQQALLQAEARTGEVAPVVHGKWIAREGEYGVPELTCSNCGRTWWGALGSKYCEECGAKMDSKVDWSECCPLIPREEAQDG